mmetsp:Transcript_36477/g.77584  ORF Transcript_36477/g.77584 Transcript_36477/m.77584 type:complete len:786 (+) Transcript_36477:78-2435(+)
MAELAFCIECKDTRPGEGVFVVGSAPEIGAWDPTKAIPCETTPEAFPKWSSKSVALQSSTGNIEFKVLIQGVKRTGAARWEGGPNRSIKAPKAKTVCSCLFGNPEVSCETLGSSGAAPGPSAPQKPQVPAKKKEEPEDTSAMPRLDTGMLFPLDEDGDSVGALQNASQANFFRRARSSANHSTDFLRMDRRSSRHLCFSSDGMVNQDMSRVPSLMMIDEKELEEDCKKHEEEVEKLEREQLNILQRRMPSGSLLEQMAEVIEEADKNSIVLMQGFNWESWRAGGGDWYSIVGRQMDRFKHLGITDIWLPPPSQSVAPQGYLPSQLFNLDGSKYGNQASLESLIKSLHENGIRAIADIVVNHRCGDKQDHEGRWNQFSTGITNRPSFAGVMDWGAWAITLGDKFSDGSGENAPGHFDGKFDAAPDIDHKNKKVQQSISVWLRWLQLQVGFDGWRFDFVKGYAAEFVGLYCEKSRPAWAVGELWGDMAYDDNGLCHNQDGHRQDLVNWINATKKKSTAFDFTTKGVLQEAVRNCQYWRLRDSNGKPPGLIGWLPKYAVTFIDNHDTGSTQRHWPFPDDKVMVGYAYILTHPGIPSIFWDHAMDWGEHVRNQIASLLQMRRETGVKVDSPVKILCADNDLYIAEIGEPACLRVALGPRDAGGADGSYWSNGPAGNCYKVWVHRTQPPKPKEAPPTPAPVVTPAPAAPAPVAKEGSKLEKEKPEANGKKKAKASLKFEAKSSPNVVEIDGEELSDETLKSMKKEDLEKLIGKLEPLLEAAKALQKAPKK